MDNSRRTAGDANVLRGQGLRPAVAATTPDFRIGATGLVESSQVQLAIRPKIERGAMGTVHGIIVHQTGGASAAGSLSSYEKDNANGAHFLIDKDGKIYQTASVFKVTHHVGHLKSRCLAEKRCSPVDLQALAGKKVGRDVGRVEAAKAWPNRYPGNTDAIGIELVGKTRPATAEERRRWDEDMVYEPLTADQQASLAWLVRMLTTALNVDMTEVLTHPTVSWKNRSEAGTATW